MDKKAITATEALATKAKDVRNELWVLYKKAKDANNLQLAFYILEALQRDGKFYLESQKVT